MSRLWPAQARDVSTSDATRTGPRGQLPVQLGVEGRDRERRSGVSTSIPYAGWRSLKTVFFFSSAGHCLASTKGYFAAKSGSSSSLVFVSLPGSSTK